MDEMSNTVDGEPEGIEKGGRFWKEGREWGKEGKERGMWKRRESKGQDTQRSDRLPTKTHSTLILLDNSLCEQP